MTSTIFAFNRGEIDSNSLDRIDIERMRLGAETQENYMPRTLGRMSLRPGLEYIATVRNSSAARGIPFIFANDDTALLEMSSDGFMRVLLSGTAVTIGSVSTSVSNDTFDSDITSWTDNSETGATAAWATGGYADLTGDGINAAILDQQVSVTGGDVSAEHFLKVVVNRGPLTFSVGSSAGDDDYVTRANLGTGTYFFNFTPTGDFHVRLQTTKDYSVLVDSVEVASSGTLEVPIPWTTEALVDSLRWAQSGDVVYIASDGYQQRKLLRYGTKAWGIALYEPEDGPFLPINVDQSINLTPSAVRGDITVTASKALFTSSHVGALFRVASAGQDTSNNLSALDAAGDTIRVTGLDADGGRNFSVVVTGTWVGTLTLEYSINEEGSWVSEETYTINQNKTFTGDNTDNVIRYWRIRFTAYTSGTATVALSYEPGSTTGVFQVTAFTNATSVSAKVVSRLGGLSASPDWYEGVWSSARGWPSSVAFYESRLCWAGKSRFRASVTDAFESFDDETPGDSGPVARSLGAGPIDKIHWMVGLQKLFYGSSGAEVAVKSNSFDEALTPDNPNLKAISTQGSKAVGAVKVDDNIFFVQKSGKRLYEIGYDANAGAQYASIDRTILVPEIGGTGGFARLAVQRQPDTRIHCVRDDGEVAVLVWDKAEEVYCWVRVVTDGASGVVEDVVVLPSDTDEEDEVYYLVKRTVNSATVRYWEKWALEANCVGGTTNEQADSFVQYSSNGSATVTGLSHLEGESVIAWFDGKAFDAVTVSSGSITLPESVNDGVVGLVYTAQYKSRKLIEAANDMVSPLNEAKQIDQIGFTLANTHHKGIQYGPDFSNLFDIAQMKGGAAVADDTVHSTWEEPLDSFGGYADQDARICLQSVAPKPCTVKSLTMATSIFPKNLRKKRAT